MVGLTRLRGPHGFCYIHRMWQDSKDSPISFFKKYLILGFPAGSVVKNQPPMQETQVQSLIQEDPTCLGVTACAPQLSSLCSRAQRSQLLSPCARSPRSATREDTAMGSLCTTARE